jgi:hypothetical protein
MKKHQKILLEELKVKSFIIDLNEDSTLGNRIKGGVEVLSYFSYTCFPDKETN